MNRQAEEGDRLADEMLAELMDKRNTGKPTPNSKPDESDKSVVTQVQAPAKEVKPEHQPATNTLQQKYDVLRGKYENEVPRLHSQLRDVNHKLKVALEELAARPATPATPANDIAKEQPDDPIEAIRESFGDELANQMQALMDARAPKQIPKQEAPEQKLKPKDESTQEPGPSKQQSEEWEEFIVNEVGGQTAFDLIDEDPKFNAWLAEYDPQYNLVRRNALVRFFRAGQLSKAAGFYIDWRSSQDSKKLTDNTLNEQLQPEAVASDISQQRTDGKKVYTMEEWGLLYDEISSNAKYRNTEKGIEKGDAIEKELDAAMKEGRVID